MSYPIRTPISKIPQHLWGIMQYYPDVFLFQLNEVQYEQLWQKLLYSKYLYTDGYEIRPASWLRYAFESFKGWLGFVNNCHEGTISYVLNKLAYFGYSNSYAQPELTAMKGYKLSPLICVQALNEKNDTTTEELQRALVKNFFQVVPHLGIYYSSQMLSSDHRFGDSWLKTGAADLVSSLHPQDDQLIADVINALDKNPQSIAECIVLKKRKFAKAAAQFYCDKAKATAKPSLLSRMIWTDPRPGYLSKALFFDPDIAKRYASEFIEHHLGQIDYPSTLELLGLLSDEKQVLNYLLRIPENDRNLLVQKDNFYSSCFSAASSWKKTIYSGTATIHRH